MASSWVPLMERSVAVGEVPVRLGHDTVDAYLRFVWARTRHNTLLAVAFDLKVFFTVVGKDPTEVTTADVLGFIEAQRLPVRGANVVRLEDGEAGLSARTIRRRLSSVSGLFEYLCAVDQVTRNPVPRGLGTRSDRRRGVPLVRSPRTLPRILDPGEVDKLMLSLRTSRDRAMIQAMLLGGLRRCEVLGLGLGDIKVGERRVFIADGKGGLLTATQDEDGLDTLGEDRFGVFVLMSGVAGVFPGAPKQTPRAVQSGFQNWAESGGLAISTHPPVRSDATWRGV